jgi:hypothetical protein
MTEVAEAPTFENTADEQLQNLKPVFLLSEA